MTSTLQNSTVLLSRLLSLKENSPLLLCIDSLAQSSYNFQLEFLHKLPKQTKVVYLSFETLEKPLYATDFIECLGVSVDKIISTVKNVITAENSAKEKTVLLIDSLNYIEATSLSMFISSLISPFVTIFATYHNNIPQRTPSKLPNYPHSLQLLEFIASSIFEIYPILSRDYDEETLENSVLKLNLPVGQCNNKIFKVTLNNRRKSGRALVYNLKINTLQHTYEPYKDSTSNEEAPITTEEELLKNLTTFNLTTSSKQKLAREQVELPFLEAQSFGSGGAIVYEYEKDDDYDEDDPYEDPF